MKVSFWDSGNSRFQCEGVSSRASKWQDLLVALTNTHITKSKWKCHCGSREIAVSNVKEFSSRASKWQDLLVAQTNTHITKSKWKCHSGTREIAVSTVKELVREFQNDKPPSSSDKYSHNLIYVKVSFWDSRNTRFQCEGVSSGASKWQNSE